MKISFSAQGEKMQQPKVQVIIPGVIPSTQMLIIKPLMELHQKGLLFLQVALESTIKLVDLDWANIVIFSRNVEPSTFPILRYLVSKGIPFIYDLDDNFFEIPPESVMGKLLQEPAYQKMLNTYVSQATLVRVYAKPLLEQIAPLTGSAKLVLGPIDWSIIRPVAQKHPEKSVKIVYATSRSQEDYLGKVFSSALEKIINKYSNKVQVFFLGFNPLNVKHYSNVHFRPFRANYDVYMRNFSSAGFDIGLAPLVEDNFHRSKSNVKYREYAACHIAGIYSNIDVYSDWVIDELTGLLVKNTETAWFYAIERLILDRELRSQIKDNAYRHAQQHFSQVKFADEWWHHIQLALSLPRPPMPKNFLNQVDSLSLISKNMNANSKPVFLRALKY